jgi:hypothetical protein
MILSTVKIEPCLSAETIGKGGLACSFLVTGSKDVTLPIGLSIPRQMKQQQKLQASISNSQCLQIISSL